MSTQIAYLIESTNVTNTGRIQGTSIRCYEVTYEYITNKWGSADLKFTPTGKMFTVKDDKIITKRTKASLQDKYMPYRNDVIHTQIQDSVRYYGCSLFATPELALAAKYMAIKARTETMISNHEIAIKSAKDQFETIPSAMFIAEEYPEYFI